MKKNTLAKRLVPFIAVFLLLSLIALLRTGRIFGHQIASSDDSPTAAADTISIPLPDGRTAVSTVEIGSDILGYGGRVPVMIYLGAEGRIDSVSPLPNDETPGFFRRLTREGLFDSWNGLTPAEALGLEVDGISGATFSSQAAIANVRAGLGYIVENLPADDVEKAAGWPPMRAVDLAVFAVVLLGAIVPLFYRDKRYRFVQQLANVAVLGFWGGTFVDYAIMLNFFANGLVAGLAGLTTILLLVIALMYPVFKHPGHYCAWVCPFGSLQDLASRLTRRKLRLAPDTIHILERLRLAIWMLLIAMLLTGWGASWIDYEIFTGFIVESASWIVIAVGLLFILLSLLTPRPFCRFLCPTGTLLRIV
ncbi:MAG: 4Fe-4S binding protein [Clostridium sp.]|nr:4Fe-4S binding protein [Clostridium sp.]